LFATQRKRETDLPSFGEKLKQERVKRKITLEQISVSTKIGTRMLQALEEDKFSQLPGGIFNKGFVRAYSVVWVSMKIKRSPNIWKPPATLRLRVPKSRFVRTKPAKMKNMFGGWSRVPTVLFAAYHGAGSPPLCS